MTNTDEFNAVGTTDVPSPGVLANDTDADPRNTLTSSIMSRPLHGSVTLDPNGAFRYQPAAGFVGDDRFVYRAADPFGLKSVPTVVTMHATLPTAGSAYLKGVVGTVAAFRIGGPSRAGTLTIRRTGPLTFVNGTITVDDRLGGTADVTFTTRHGRVPGTVTGRVTIVDPRLGGTSQYRVSDTQWQAPNIIGHARRISGSAPLLVFTAGG